MWERTVWLVWSTWIKGDQLDVTCFIISLFNAQHVSDVNASILRSLRLIFWVISWVVLLWFDVCWCYVVVWLGWCGIRMQALAFTSILVLGRLFLSSLTHFSHYCSNWSPFFSSTTIQNFWIVQFVLSLFEIPLLRVMCFFRYYR